MVVRAVSWPRDIPAIARSLSRSRAWFWLDGSSPVPGEQSELSYLAETSQVVQARPGEERRFLRSLRSAHSTGWVVALGYEFGARLLGETPCRDDVPSAFAMRPSAMLVLDHAAQTAEIRADDEAMIEEWLARHGEALHMTSSSRSPGERYQARFAQLHPGDEAHWRREDQRYLEDVQACKQAIRDGEAYVLCLTDTAELPARNVDPLGLYLELRETGAAVRGAVIVTEGRALVSASPERFLSKRGAAIATHPIKGTRPRGMTPEADAALAAELSADPKERAENLMIVDLMRNDLSRVCLPGSVNTEGFLRVEQHPRVHQLVSTVTGTLRDECDVVDAIEACFPGGSMTGAPKRRAVQLLADLERAPRGLYSGCFGWLDGAGDAEVAMSIRCVELRWRNGEQIALIGAGGGVTADSVAESELAEKQLKARALLSAIVSLDTEYS